MQINSISNQNFGKFEGWEYFTGLPKMSNSDIRTCRNIENLVNEKYWDTLKIHGTVGCPDKSRPDVKYVRLKSYPLREDMSIIKVHRPEARSHDYMRKSLWIPIYDRFMEEKIFDFLNGQSKYIRYCIKHPDHNLRRISMTEHKF